MRFDAAGMAARINVYAARRAVPAPIVEDGRDEIGKLGVVGDQFFACVDVVVYAVGLFGLAIAIEPRLHALSPILRWIRCGVRLIQQTTLGAVPIGPVTLEDRRRELEGDGDQLTGLLHRETTAVIPAGTRLIKLVLEAEVGNGANDGYADNLSLILMPVITELPRNASLDSFYKKHALAAGLPVISSGEVSDRAIAVAVDTIHGMLSKRPDVAKALAKLKVRVAVMAPDELTTDIPEHSDLEPKDYWDKRARGLGATIARPVCSCAEENLLGHSDDRYRGESILIHEFAHTVHLGLRQVDPNFDAKLGSSCL